MLPSVELEAVRGREVIPESHTPLVRVVQALMSSKRIAVVTGAGISVTAGIPDFRSADGLYARVLSAPTTGQGPPITAKGKDFFDASFFTNAATRPLFNRFIAELIAMSAAGKPTRTHSFIKGLADSGRLVRWYTQNIDGLERAAGLMTSSCADKPPKQTPAVVTLHGSLGRMICTICRGTVQATDDHARIMSKGDSPPCDRCSAYASEREASGKRSVKTGFLRPDIVLYNEPHPHGEMIAEHVSEDLSKRPQILLVMGTSLKVVGLKKLVKDFARSVHGNVDGLVVFVNKTSAPRSEWQNIFDVELLGDCDSWITELECRMMAALAARRLQIPQPAPKFRSTAGPLAARCAVKRDGRIDQIFKVVRRGEAASAEVAIANSKCVSGISAKNPSSKCDDRQTAVVSKSAQIHSLSVCESAVIAGKKSVDMAVYCGSPNAKPDVSIAVSSFFSPRNTRKAGGAHV